MALATELLLIRHGEVVGTRTGKRVPGTQDPPLSERGREMAERLSLRLAAEEHIAALYSSPMMRARQTADIIASHIHLRPEVVEALREWDFTRQMRPIERMQLLVVTTLSHLAPFRRLLIAQWRDNAALKSFVSETVTAVEQISHAHAGQQVAIVAHGGTIDAVLTHYFPADDKWERGVIRNCSLTRIALDAQGAQLLAFNDIRGIASVLP